MNMRESIGFGVLLLALCSVPQSFADKAIVYRTTVIGVVNGDTIVITNKIGSYGISLRSEVPVKLDAVDAPELGQAGGEAAKAYLEDLLLGKEIFVEELTDSGKSRGAWVYVDEQGKGRKSVNLLILKEGHAWPAKPRIHGQFSYEQVKKESEESRKQGKGIWSQQAPEPPWEWIKKHPVKKPLEVKTDE